MSPTNVTRFPGNSTFDHSMVVDYWTDEKFDKTLTKFIRVNVSDNAGTGGVSSRSENVSTASSSSERNLAVVWSTALKIAIFCLIIAGTVVGNLLVCAAICLTRKLRTASNLLIISLAVSDLLVGTVDMPFAVVYDVMGEWILGQTLCDLWTSLDVLVCTASILNLCMISIDRYMTVTKPFIYASPAKRNPIRIFLMISTVWILSTIISVPPLLGWKPAMTTGECEVSQDKGYQFFATVCAFYLPLCIMIIVYARLYLVSSRLAKTMHTANFHKRNSSLTPNSEAAINTIQQSHTTTTVHQESDCIVEERSTLNPSRSNGSLPSILSFPFTSPLSSPVPDHRIQSRQSRSHSLADVLIRMNCRLRDGVGGIGLRLRAYDWKATRTLGVIMGAFVACWLPFFVLAVTKPFIDYPSTTWSRHLDSLFLWLGYTNSLLNPIIYARFNRDFRTPFKCILQCRCTDINSRLRSEDFAEQFGQLRFCRTVPCFSTGPSGQHTEVTPGRTWRSSNIAALSSLDVAEQS